jgi:ABC-type multidrug transport system fused ATPase/permease subunit
VQRRGSLIPLVRGCADLLEPKTRARVAVLGIFQVLSAVLDLLGLLTVGLLAALLAGASLPTSIASLLPDLSLENTQGTVFAVGALFVCLLLCVKSVLNALLSRMTLRALAAGQAQIASRLARDVLSADLLTVTRRPSQELSYILTTGTYSAILVVLGQAVILVSEIALVLLLSAGLFLLSPFLAILATAFFGLVALAIHRLFANWAVNIGEGAKNADISSIRTIQEAVRGIREIRVADRMSFFENRFYDERISSSQVQADLAFLSVLPKYVFEVALIGGAAVLGAFELWRNPVPIAIATMATFLVAGSRMVPSLLRLQGAIIQLKAAAGPANEVIMLSAELDEPCIHFRNLERPRDAPWPLARIEVTGLSFRYPDAPKDVFADLTLSIDDGSLFAVVGPSGGGKSTLLDLMTGLLVPDNGSVTIGSLSPSEVEQNWPDFIAYVPQTPLMIDGSIRDNVALGIPKEAIDDDAVRRALQQTHVWDLVASIGGLDSQVGELGAKLSGGQRQRLGLARSLYRMPRLLLLDEATSALDAESEALIAETILEISGATTVVVVAHRLSTARVADHIAYVADGKVITAHSFNELRERVPKFDLQASLSGLDGPA